MSGIKSGKRPKKVSKPRKGGRTPLDKQRPEIQVSRDPVVEDTSTAQTLEALDDMERADEDPYELMYFHQTKSKKCYGGGTNVCRDKDQKYINN